MYISLIIQTRSFRCGLEKLHCSRAPRRDEACFFSPEKATLGPYLTLLDHQGFVKIAQKLATMTLDQSTVDFRPRQVRSREFQAGVGVSCSATTEELSNRYGELGESNQVETEPLQS